MEHSKHFSRLMGRWLMTLLLVMLTSLATRAAEAYANYTPANKTLTFYYDNLRSSRPGTTYDIPSSYPPDWADDGTNSSITKVVFNNSFAAVNCSSTAYWFVDMEKLQSITGMQYLNTTEVTDMSGMFDGCQSLTNLDVSGFNTANVTDMSGMFWNCSALTSLDLSNFNTANVTEMRNMFQDCSALTSLDLSNFNTTKVTNMTAMFRSCSELTSLDLSNFNTAKVTEMISMFDDCSSLTSLDLSTFNTAKVTEMDYMFKSCPLLRTIYVGRGWNTAAVTSSDEMFYSCTRLVGGKGTTYSAYHVDKAYARVDLGPSQPGYLTYIEPAEIYAKYTLSNTTLTLYYDNLKYFRSGATYTLSQSWGYWESETITDVILDPSMADARPTSTYAWFAELYEITTIQGLNYLNTSQVTNMCAMFSGCQSLTSLDLSHFDTSKVTNMGGMFGDCESLTSLDLSSFNTAKVTNMGSMFYACRGLTTLDLSNFNTAKVTDMTWMFASNDNLRSIDLSSFNTSQVTDMWGMFMYCPALTSLDLSSFNTANVTNMREMFLDCNSLRTIYAGSGWSTAAVDDAVSMFYGCNSLVGGKGTTYDEDHDDISYAHIDGGPSNPGYFTDKNASLRGDVNGDNKVNIVDVTALINYLLGDTASSINLTAADCNTDGNITITDVTALINYLLGGTW